MCVGSSAIGQGGVACSKNIDAGTVQKLATYQSCAVTQCLEDCVPVPVGTGGSANGGAGGGFAWRITGLQRHLFRSELQHKRPARRH